MQTLYYLDLDTVRSRELNSYPISKQSVSYAFCSNVIIVNALLLSEEALYVSIGLKITRRTFSSSGTSREDVGHIWEITV